ACAKARLNKTPSAVKTVFVLRFLAARPKSCPFKTETRVEFFINLSETSVSLSLRKHRNRGQAEQSVPQRLSRVHLHYVAARINPCPFKTSGRSRHLLPARLESCPFKTNG